MRTLTIWKQFALIGIAVGCLFAQSDAQEASKDERDPRSKLIPVFELTGTSEGEGTVRIGVDWLIPFANKQDELRVKLSFEAASHDGLSTLFEGTSDGFRTESKVGGALELIYTQLQKAPGIDEQTTDVKLLARGLPNCTARHRALGPQADDVCRDATIAIHEADNQAKLPLPKQQVALSLSGGQSEFSHLLPTADLMVLASETVREPWFAASLRFARYSPVSRISTEVAGSLQSSHEASSQNARWCTPVGMVESDPAETCDEMPLGAPTKTTTATAAAYVGLVGHDHDWRAAIGPVTSFGFGGDKLAYDLGIELPFYLVRSTAGFSGVVRVAPAAFVTRDADGVSDTKILLTLTLLGSRTLFDTAFR